MECNQANTCMGGHGNCLNVKITNRCNAHCAFCIEREGYAPPERDVESLIQATLAMSNYPSVLILGGEPLLYSQLEKYLKGIRPHKENIYLTTNGALLEKNAEMLAKYLDGVNISIHSPKENVNDRCFKAHICFEQLRAGIRIFQREKIPVRINCNLVRGVMDTPESIEEMIRFASSMCVDHLRFSELQQAKGLFVDSRRLFKGLPDNPYRDGCEKEPTGQFPVKVTVKLTCGLIDPQKPPVTEESEYKPSTRVLYPDGQISCGWLNNAGNPHEYDCRRPVRPC